MSRDWHKVRLQCVHVAAKVLRMSQWKNELGISIPEVPSQSGRTTRGSASLRQVDRSALGACGRDRRHRKKSSRYTYAASRSIRKIPSLSKNADLK